MQNQISRDYENLNIEKRNTVIPFDVIDKYPFIYQCFLEQIADFLIEEDVYWKETETGILFYDIIPSTLPSMKLAHHFRSYTIKQEADYVKVCWNICLQKAKLIPAKIIQINDDGETKLIDSLNYFNSMKQVDQLDLNVTPLNVTPVACNLLSLELTSPQDMTVSPIQFIETIVPSGSKSQANNTESEQDKSIREQRFIDQQRR